VKDSSVLIVGLNYAPEPVGIGPYTQGLAEALAARGAQVRVVCGQPFYPHWRIDAAYAGSGWSADDDNGVKVTRCPHFVPAQPSALKRILHLASFASSALLPALIAALRARRDKPDLVITIAPALPSVFTAWLAARLSGAMLWIHVQDFEVEVAMATGLLGKGSPLAHAATWVERRLLALGEAVSTISPQMCCRLIDKGIAPTECLKCAIGWTTGSCPILTEPQRSVPPGTFGARPWHSIRAISPASKASKLSSRRHACWRNATTSFLSFAAKDRIAANWNKTARAYPMSCCATCNRQDGWAR
jgi:hypothetical protein